ncbi:Glycoside hydrolase, family 5 [Dillenia turbinata]|uniref:Glycoside hydrolase, family 5 n=1 Tax=Dillenia turbinata TaxID=194707 RepID=A0AAN8ZDI5_9MAGN
MLRKVLQTLLVLSLSLFAPASYALPLSTKSRWIVDSTSGSRVKLKCIDWAAHMQTMLAEGLDRKPLSDIASQVSSLGFNCVRLTWATFMFTRTEYGNLGVAQSLKTLGLVEAMRGLEENNPSFMNLTVLEAYVAVVDELGKHELMVVLDNHVSMPMWCCSDNDGNGFFGDKFFTPSEWLEGLITVTKRFKGMKQVVGMSLRNELRGPRQNVLDWYRYLGDAARRIHAENPHVLVILGGLSYCTSLDFLKKRPFGTNLDNKLVYEAHWYSFSRAKRQKWEVNTLSQVCAKEIQGINNRSLFLTKEENSVPLFLNPSTSDLMYLILYHPQSGRCIHAKSNNIYASDCWRPSQWDHDRDEAALRLIGTDLCLQVVGDGLPAVLSTDCSSNQSTWTFASSSRLHLAASDQEGRLLCLEMNSTNPHTIMTNTCICLGDGSVCDRDPQSDLCLISYIDEEKKDMELKADCGVK